MPEVLTLPNELVIKEHPAIVEHEVHFQEKNHFKNRAQKINVRKAHPGRVEKYKCVKVKLVNKKS